MNRINLWLAVVLISVMQGCGSDDDGPSSPTWGFRAGLLLKDIENNTLLVEDISSLPKEDVGIVDLAAGEDGTFTIMIDSYRGDTRRLRIGVINESVGITWIHQRDSINFLPRAILICNNGDLCITGEKDSQIYLSRIASDGAILWERTYDFGSEGGNWNSGLALEALSDGSIVVGGRIGAWADSTSYGILSRHEGNGDLLWESDCSDYGCKYITDIVVDDGDRIVAIGADPVEGVGAFLVVGLDGSIDVSVTYDHEGNKNVFPGTVLQVSDGTFILCGALLGNPSSETRAWVQRVDASGDVIWNYSGANEFWHFGVRPTGAIQGESVLLAGNSQIGISIDDNLGIIDHISLDGIYQEREAIAANVPVVCSDRAGNVLMLYRTSVSYEKGSVGINTPLIHGNIKIEEESRWLVRRGVPFEY